MYGYTRGLGRNYSGGLNRVPKGPTLRQVVREKLKAASQKKELEKLKIEVAGMEAELQQYQ